MNGICAPGVPIAHPHALQTVLPTPEISGGGSLARTGPRSGAKESHGGKNEALHMHQSIQAPAQEKDTFYEAKERLVAPPSQKPAYLTQEASSRSTLYNKIIFFFKHRQHRSRVQSSKKEQGDGWMCHTWKAYAVGLGGGSVYRASVSEGASSGELLLFLERFQEGTNKTSQSLPGKVLRTCRLPQLPQHERRATGQADHQVGAQ